MTVRRIADLHTVGGVLPDIDNRHGRAIISAAISE